MTKNIKKRVTYVDDEIMNIEEYDDVQRCIHFKNNQGYEIFRSYDKDGLQSFWWNSNGDYRYIEFNEKGRAIYDKNAQSSGYTTEVWYDDEGNEIHYKDSLGNIEWCEYDDFHRCVLRYTTDEILEEYKYSEGGFGNRLVYSFKDGIHTTFDQNGHRVYEKDENEESTDEWRYNDMGFVIYHRQCRKNSDVYEQWWEYDSAGNEVLCKDSDGNTRRTEYEYYDN